MKAKAKVKVSGIQLDEADQSELTKAKQETNSANIKRQREQISEEESAEAHTKKIKSEYARYLRIAAASTIQLPVNYYSGFIGSWTPPKVGETFGPEHEYEIAGPETEVVAAEVDAAQSIEVENQKYETQHSLEKLLAKDEEN